MNVSIRVGCVTPVGGCWEQTADSVRSTIIRRQVVELEGENYVRARVDDQYLSEFVSQEHLESRMHRCAGLLDMAFADLTAKGDLPEAMPAFVALPESASAADSDSNPILTSLQGRRNSGQLQLRKVFNYGPAGGIAAVRAGLKFLQSNNDANAVLVGAVDCLTVHPELESLRAKGHLLALGGRDGVIPGEGAVVIVLTRRDESPDGDVFTFSETAFTTANGDRYDEAAGWSEDLSELFATVAESVSGAIKTVFVAYDGSNISSEEWSKASLVLADKVQIPYDLQTPALCFGNLGASAPLAAAAIAVRGIGEEYLAGPALLWAVSDDGKMGATAIARVSSGHQVLSS